MQLRLGGPITRHECDAGLLMLAMAGLPRAGVEDGDIELVRSVYFDLLHEAEITGAMMKSACQRYIMRPASGKPKFFPDPGQIAEMCAPEVRDRKREMARLEGALALLDGPSAGAPVENHGFDPGVRMRDLAEQMRVKAGSPQSVATETEKPTFPSTARANTDAAELREHINKKTGTR